MSFMNNTLFSILTLLLQARDSKYLLNVINMNEIKKLSFDNCVNANALQKGDYIFTYNMIPILLSTVFNIENRTCIFSHEWSIEFE